MSALPSDPTKLPLDQAITRFRDNEIRVNAFANGGETDDMTTSDTRKVPSLSKLFRTWSDRFNTFMDNLQASANGAQLGVPADKSITLAKFADGVMSAINVVFTNDTIGPAAARNTKSKLSDIASVLDYDTFAHAIADPTRRLWVPRGVYIINESITIAADLILDKGATIVVGSASENAGTRLAITGHIDAPMQQIFAGFGSVVFAPQNRNLRAHPEWWGARSGQGNDGGAINNAIAAVRGTKTPVHFSGDYTIEGGAQIVFYPDMCATSDPASEISGGGQGTGPIFAPGNYIGHEFVLPRLALFSGFACVLAGASLLDLRVPSIQACGGGFEGQCGGSFNGAAIRTLLDNKVTCHVMSGIANNAIQITAKENEDVAQGNEFYVNFATGNQRAVLFFAPGLSPNWDSNKFVFQAIDANVPGGSGLVAIAANPVPRTVFRCETWFGGIPDNGAFVAGAFAGLDWYSSNNDAIANYNRWQLSGPGNRIKSSFTGLDRTYYAAMSSQNTRGSFNGGNPIDATAFMARLAGVTIAQGASLTFFVYSPYITPGCNRPRVIPKMTSGLIPWGVDTTGNANEVAITVINLSGGAFNGNQTADFWVDFSGD